jgi:hypothetical protein
MAALIYAPHRRRRLLAPNSFRDFFACDELPASIASRHNNSSAMRSRWITSLLRRRLAGHSFPLNMVGFKPHRSRIHNSSEIFRNLHPFCIVRLFTPPPPIWWAMPKRQWPMACSRASQTPPAAILPHRHQRQTECHRSRCACYGRTIRQQLAEAQTASEIAARGKVPLALPVSGARWLGQFCFGDLPRRWVRIQPALTTLF